MAKYGKDGLPTLTQTVVDRLKADGKDEYRWDSSHDNLCIRIRKSGAMSWAVRYTHPVEKRRDRWVTISPVRDLTLADARKAAAAIMGRVAKGEDPAGDAERAVAARAEAETEAKAKAEAAAKAEAKTVEAMLLAFMPSHFPFIGERTRIQYKRHIERYLIPSLGKLVAAKVEHEHVETWHRSVKSRYEANRALATLSVAFSWGVPLKWATYNPCAFIKKFPERMRKEWLEGDALTEFCFALADEAENHYYEAMALRFMLLSGARHGETLSIKWQDVNLKTATVYVPVHKTSATTGAKSIHLSPAAVEFLTVMQARRREGAVFVFDPGEGRGDKDGQLTQSRVHKAWVRVRNASGIGSRYHIHDLRHTFASAALASGETIDVIGAMLGQHHTTTTARYAHLADRKAKAAAKNIGAAMGRIIPDTDDPNIRFMRDLDKEAAGK